MIGFEFVLLVSYQVVNYFSHELLHVANLSRAVLSSLALSLSDLLEGSACLYFVRLSTLMLLHCDGLPALSYTSALHV